MKKDIIYRDDAIKVIEALAVPLLLDRACENIWERDRTLDKAIDVIRGLSSAQPLDVQLAYHKGVNDGIDKCLQLVKGIPEKEEKYAPGN